MATLEPRRKRNGPEREETTEQMTNNRMVLSGGVMFRLVTVGSGTIRVAGSWGNCLMIYWSPSSRRTIKNRGVGGRRLNRELRELPAHVIVGPTSRHLEEEHSSTSMLREYG